MELNLEILAFEIENSSYIDTDDCAITRALRRAGRPDLQDQGLCISYKYPESFKPFIDGTNETYTELAQKVRDMYYGRATPEDFTHTLIY